MKRTVQPPKSGKKEIGKGKIPFFKSLKSVLRSVKVIFRMDWRNIPAFVINQFLVTLQPFVALFFSAGSWIYLSAGAERQTVVSWILAAVFCNYGVYLLERLTACSTSVEGITLYWQLYQEMSRVMMRADYEELEKPEIGLAKERIERADPHVLVWPLGSARRSNVAGKRPDHHRGRPGSGMAGIPAGKGRRHPLGERS